MTTQEEPPSAHCASQSSRPFGYRGRFRERNPFGHHGCEGAGSEGRIDHSCQCTWALHNSSSAHSSKRSFCLNLDGRRAARYTPKQLGRNGTYCAVATVCACIRRGSFAGGCCKSSVSREALTPRLSDSDSGKVSRRQGLVSTH